MAKLDKTTVTVEKVIEVEEEAFTLTLSRAEAEALNGLLYYGVGGLPKFKELQAIRESLARDVPAKYYAVLETFQARVD